MRHNRLLFATRPQRSGFIRSLILCIAAGIALALCV